MKIGYCTGAYPEKPLAEVFKMAADLGYEAVDINAIQSNRQQFDAQKIIDGASTAALKKALKETGLFVSALSCHADSMLILGPHGSDTDHIFKGSPAEKVRHGTECLLRVAQAANLLEISVVVGFTGISNFGRFYPFPYKKGWAEEEEAFVERFVPILDKFKEYGVRYAVEPLANNLVYDIHTAERSIELLGGHPAWGFNLDPANMLYLGLQVENFIDRLGKKIFHVHAKDAEVVMHNLPIGGTLMQGDWRRIDRSFRFRIPGWGDVPWKKVITELALVGYDDVLAYEHEDITMSREDGLKKAIDFLRPLMIGAPYEGPFGRG